MALSTAHLRSDRLAIRQLVNDLQSLGYLERRADPTDGRATLIHPTPRGRALLDAAGGRVAEIEADWRARLPNGECDRACRALDQLLGQLGTGGGQVAR